MIDVYMNLKALVNYENPDSFASKLRKKRSQYLKKIVTEISQKNGGCRILDLGGTHSYWKAFPDSWLHHNNVKITLLNIEQVSIPSTAIDLFESVKGNACNLAQYRNAEFDLVHSNSVIEHVGGWDKMRAMAEESLRVGKYLYLQTPYFWFPVEPHFLTPFIHWLPMSTRIWLACKIKMGNWPQASSVDEAIRAQQSAVLLDKRMLEALFPDASIHFEKFLGLPKSLVATSRAFSR